MRQRKMELGETKVRADEQSRNLGNVRNKVCENGKGIPTLCDEGVRSPSTTMAIKWVWNATMQALSRAKQEGAVDSLYVVVK